MEKHVSVEDMTDVKRYSQMVDALAAVLEHHTERGTIERLERGHRNDGQGLCTGCRQWEQPMLSWPCNISRAVFAIRRRQEDARTGSPGAQDESSTPLRVVE